LKLTEANRSARAGRVGDPLPRAFVWFTWNATQRSSEWPLRWSNAV